MGGTYSPINDIITSFMAKYLHSFTSLSTIISLVYQQDIFFLSSTRTSIQVAARGDWLMVMIQPRIITSYSAASDWPSDKTCISSVTRLYIALAARRSEEAVLSAWSVTNQVLYLTVSVSKWQFPG